MPETMRGVWQGRRSGAAEDMLGPSGDVQQGPVAWEAGGGRAVGLRCLLANFLILFSVKSLFVCLFVFLLTKCHINQDLQYFFISFPRSWNKNLYLPLIPSSAKRRKNFPSTIRGVGG